MADPTDIKHYDLQGYSRDERVKKSENLYELEEWEKKNVNEVASFIKKGKYTLAQCETCLSHIEKLDMKLTKILAMEESQGLVNTEIKAELGHIRELKLQLVTLVGKKRRGI